MNFLLFFAKTKMALPIETVLTLLAKKNRNQTGNF